MKHDLSPKGIEKNFLFMVSRDGILDIFFGLMLVAAGINGIYTALGWETPWYIRFLILLLLIPVFIGKLFVTTPRLGYIKMKPIEGGRRRILRVFLIISSVITLIMIAYSVFNKGTDQQLSLSPVIMFGAILVLMSFVAWLIGVYSIFFVGLCTGFGFFLARPIHLGTILGMPADLFIFCIPGLLISFYGAHRLYKFLKAHPKQNLNTDYGQ